MKTTLSVIKADVGSIGGRIAPALNRSATIRGHVAYHGDGVVNDCFIASAGDDIAILMTHIHGTGNPEVHRLAWEVFQAGTEPATAKGCMVPAKIYLPAGVLRPGHVAGQRTGVRRDRIDSGTVGEKIPHPRGGRNDSVACRCRRLIFHLDNDLPVRREP